MKKRGFGAGKWNGFGGKVEPGETVEAGAIRELREEANIVALDLVQKGLLLFDFEQEGSVETDGQGKPVMGSYGERLEVHVFTASDFEGTFVDYKKEYIMFAAIMRLNLCMFQK
jgi:8-oxo-dGTP diphosphatase/2-hydroxy-dATP diphosphatase